MRRKIGRLISLVVLIFSLNIVVCQASTESHISPIDENKYMVVEDSFDRGLWSGISTRIKASINQIFKNNNGTIYEDLQIKYITVDGKRLNTEEIKKNPNLLKDVFLNRDNSKGLQNIDITSINQDKYSYSRYLNLIQQDIQPLQIALNTIWTKEKGPYYITGEVQVLKGATLTIEEGTTVYFNNIEPNKNKSGILVDGKLKIEGTENEPVQLLPRSESSSQGSWKGIYVTERGTLDVEYAKIEGAGSWTGSAIYTLGNAKLNHIEINNTLGNGIMAFKNIEIQNSIIKNNSGYGVDLYRYLKDYKTIVTDNVFTNNQSVGRIVIRDTKSTQYDVTNNDTINNGMDNIILGGAIVGKMGFTNPGEDSGYQIINTHAVNGEMDKFSISKNSEVSFNNTQININTNTKSISDSEIDINGKLMINNSLITNGDYDNWYGLYVSDTGELVINNSHLTNAIKPIFSKGKVTLNQSKIKNTLSGIYSEGDLVSLDSEFKNIRSSAFKSYTFNKKTNLIINNTKFSDIQGSIGDVYVSQSGGNIKFSNVKTDEKVKENFIHLSGSLSESTDFDNIGDGIPYVISDLSILKDATVNFNAGSILKIENGVYFGYKSGIDVYGELNLNGTSNNRVSVTSFRDDRIGGDSNGDGKNSIASAGDWGSINYHASSKNRNSQITYTDILYGGDHREGYALGGEGSFNIQSSKVANSSEAGIGVLGTIVIQDSILEENHGYGVHVRSRDNFNLIMNGNYFKDNQDYAALVEFDSTFNHIEMSGNEAYNNKINGVGLTGTILSDLELISAGDKFPYVVPKTLVIEEGKSLTLNPNTVVKFESEGQIDVYGNLLLNGQQSNKVYLTSINDDDNIVGGDTNNDGNATTAEAGDWKSINLYSNTRDNQSIQMNYSVISYGGNCEKDYMIGGEGAITLKNSQVESSLTNGLSVYGNTLMNLILENNYFENNTKSAAVAKFATENDKIRGNNNTAVNNQINGLSIEGSINEENTFEKLGDEFPYVVGNGFTIERNYSLALESGVVIKYSPNSQLDVKGHLITNGTISDKVYFTSLLDDSKAGDTNNDVQSSEAQDEDWKGIVYHANSEGTFNHFECKYSTLNMDYVKIPYLKVVSNGDNQVAAIDNYFAYVQKNNEDYQVVLYDISKKTEKVLSSSSNKIKNVILDNSSNIINVAWLEEGRMFVNNGGGNHSQQLFTDYQNISYFHLMGNNIVFINDGSIYYGDIGNGAVHKLENASLKFTPLVSNQYLFYLNKESNMIHRLVLDGTKSEHYVMSLYENVITGDIYGNDIAFLASHEDALNKEIIIGDIPSWTAIQIPGNNYNYHNLSLYKDKLAFTLNKDLTSREELYISESSSNNNINIVSTISESYFTIGYSNFDHEIGNKSLIFSDDELIYLVETTIGTKNETYVHQGKNNNSYDREISLGSNFQIGLGATASAYGVVHAGINFNISKEGNLSYKLHHNSLNATNKLTLGREIINGVSLGSNLDIGLHEKVNVTGVGATITGTTLNKDQYTYSLHEEDSYKNIGLLSGAGILNYLTSNNLTLKNILFKAISNVIETTVNPNESSQAYTLKSGIGLETSLNSYLGVKLRKTMLSGGWYAETGLNSTSYAEYGVEKSENELDEFVSIKSGIKANFSRFFGWDGGISIPNTKLSIKTSWNKLLPILSQKKTEEVGLEIQTSINKNKELTLSFTDFSETSYGYQLSYNFIIPDALEVNKQTGLLEGIDELYNKIGTGLLISNDSIVMGYLHDLVKLIDKDVLIKYEVRLTKANPKTTAKLVDKSGKIYKPDGTALENLTPLVSLNGKSNDVISFVVDSGRFKNGVIIDENLVIAYIPVEDTSIWGIIGQVFHEFENQINPQKIEFDNNKINYENICIKVPGNLAHEAVLISTPVDIKNDVSGRFEINENEYIVDDFIYVDIRDISGNSITSYPDTSKLEFMIPNKYFAKKDYAAIYEYDEHNDDWIKRGGKITKNTDGTYSINIEINQGGQYALGFDKNQPQVIFKHQGIALSSDTQLFLNDYIDIQIIDDLPLKNVVLKLNGKEIKNYGSSSQFSYGVQGDLGNRYILEVVYQDRFGNEFKDSITYVIKEKNTNTLIEDERTEITDEIIHEVTNDISNELINQEDEVTDEIIGSEDNIETGLPKEEIREKVDNQGEIDLPSNKDELESE